MGLGLGIRKGSFQPGPSGAAGDFWRRPQGTNSAQGHPNPQERYLIVYWQCIWSVWERVSVRGPYKARHKRVLQAGS